VSRPLLLGAFLASAVCLVPATADAGVRVRIGGSASISIGGGPHRVHRSPRVVRVAPRRPAPRPRIDISGSIRIGGYVRYAQPPPPVAYADCNCDTSTYYPLAPVPVVGVVAARPALPKWGLGLFAGGVAVEGQEAARDLGVAGRLRLTPRLLLDGEIAKSEQGPDNLVTRTDRRLAAGLTYELSPYARFSPLVLGGLGVTQTELDGTWTSGTSFGEVGVGLRYALTPRVHASLDVRAGSRTAIDQQDVSADARARMVGPSPDESEEYTSARVGAMIWF